MAIDFTLSPELEDLRVRVRDFLEEVVVPTEKTLDESDRDAYVTALLGMRKAAHEAGLWCPHMPEELGGMGLSHVEMAMVQAEAAKTYYGPWVMNCQAPDEGNMHTLLHWANEDQKERYLKPLCDGRMWSCFAMTEPEVAGSDPTLIQTRAYQDGDEWVINGHKWFISNAHRANFAILCLRRPTPRSWSTSRATAGPRSARSRPCTARPGTRRSSSRICGSTTTRCSAAGDRGTCWVRPDWARPGWLTACGGSPRPRPRST